MSTDARNDAMEVVSDAFSNEEIRQKLRDLVEALVRNGYGSGGPALETTFTHMEVFGHESGKKLAQALQELLASQHAQHFDGSCSCPECGGACPPLDAPSERPFRTGDGEIHLSEPRYHCPVCNRDFFPSASSLRH